MLFRHDITIFPWLCECLVSFVLNYFYYFYFGSSFNDKPINDAVSGPIGKELFEKEQDDLLSDLKDIPKKACDRRVSLLIYFFVCFNNIFPLK